MERVPKKPKNIGVFIRSIPRDIWKFLLLPRVHLKALGLLAQTCRLFQELVKGFRTNNIVIAKRYKANYQPLLSLRCYQSCLDHGNTDAMCYFGYLRKWYTKHTATNNYAELFKRTAEGGNAIGMVQHAYELRLRDDHDVGKEFAKMALLSGNAYAIAECHYFGLGTSKSLSKAMEFHRISAKQSNDEYSQYRLGSRHYVDSYELQLYDRSEKLKQAIYWFLKAAKQGHIEAQDRLVSIYNISGCEAKAKIWKTRVQRQLQIIREFFDD